MNAHQISSHVAVAALLELRTPDKRCSGRPQSKQATAGRRVLFPELSSDENTCVNIKFSPSQCLKQSMTNSKRSLPLRPSSVSTLKKPTNNPVLSKAAESIRKKRKLQRNTNAVVVQRIVKDNPTSKHACFIDPLLHQVMSIHLNIPDSEFRSSSGVLKYVF